MAEHSGFFNAKLVNGEYDRLYYAEDFAKYFANFVGNGVFEENLNELIVSQNDVANMGVKVLSGQGFINGYRYENDNEFFLTIDTADGILNRIDLVVLRFTLEERRIRLAIKKGVSAINAVVPDIQRDADIYELKLAEVSVKAGATNISQTDIVDTRSNKDVCGFVRTIPDKELRKIVSDFEAIRKTNEEMWEDIEGLKRNLSVESEQNPGCFYKITDNGETEWVNPPMKAGIEYRTTERFEGYPVYVKRFYVAKMTNATAMTVSLGAAGNKIISVEGYMYDTVNAAMNLFPHVKTNVVNTSAALGSVNSNGRLTIYVAADLTTFECYVTVKYIK